MSANRRQQIVRTTVKATSESQQFMEPVVVYVVSSELVKISSLLPSNQKRSLLLHSLIKAFGLLSPIPVSGKRGIQIVQPLPATIEELTLYHDSDYLNILLSSLNVESKANLAEWGLEDDCPIFPGLPEYVRMIGGATLTAARSLRHPKVGIAICWDGGRHHARKSQASGYCYVADCVLAIMTLRRTNLTTTSPTPMYRPKIMYLDLDLHFSDGVSEAFYAPVRSTLPWTLTLSIHHAASGFYPTSFLSDLPPEDPANCRSFDPFTLSIPLKEGASNRTYARIWPIVERVKEAFSPDYIILQCGCDGLSGDPCAKFNWSLGDEEGSFGWCVQRVVKQWRVKTLLLGGGGYNFPNAARAWAYLTSVVGYNSLEQLDQSLDLEVPIPDHEGFPYYAPSFTLNVPAGMMRDQNTEEYLRSIEYRYEHIIEMIKHRVITQPTS
ncbi:hypothetical protein AMATHDRAFT_3872 [Amanita thiersii Skay4041]|uniref:Histone deacetylase 8 n=1 Tax=Amanita thiersii Skay4041 TaxID=703135 RepID=A0A2A9NQ91_9AGAR|nr:hypothetical protein AMATHDRAFT_3872 [Amanita thiersii Skay4041]